MDKDKAGKPSAALTRHYRTPTCLDSHSTETQLTINSFWIFSLPVYNTLARIPQRLRSSNILPLQCVSVSMLVHQMPSTLWTGSQAQKRAPGVLFKANALPSTMKLTHEFSKDVHNFINYACMRHNTHLIP